MAVKNILAAVFSGYRRCFDGRARSNWKNGDMPSGRQTGPKLLNTDIVSGSTTGFENNKGCYLSLFGYLLGSQADLGTNAGARVYMRDSAGANTWVEVDNYRALVPSRTWAINEVVQLIVQVGALGGKTGNLDVKVTVNGVDTNILTNQFYVQPGRCAYVSLTGNDATAMFDDITKPFRYAQNYSGASPVAGSLWAATTTMGETGLRAGDTICLRAGTYTDQTGWDSRWIRFKDQTGTNPNGVIGNGYIHITRHPGAVLAHSPEVVFHNGGSGGGGGIHGVNTANAGAGNGQRWTVSGLKIYSNAVTLDADSAPINCQQGNYYGRIFDCDLSWPGSVQANLAAGVSISQADYMVVKFNYIHEISGSTLQNHGVYLGSYSDGTNWHSSNNNLIAYNWIKNITGGNGFQYHRGNADGVSEGVGNVFHTNLVDTCGKRGLNLVEGCKGLDAYNNKILNTIDAGVFCGMGTITGLAVNIYFNTLYNCGQQGTSSNGSLEADGTIPSGTINMKYNMVLLEAGRSTTQKFYNTNGTDTAVLLENNLYYDYKGIETTKPAKDVSVTSVINQNPLVTDLSASDFTLTASSPGLTAVSGAPVISTDFFGIARPAGANASLGACEGIGT